MVEPIPQLEGIGFLALSERDASFDALLQHLLGDGIDLAPYARPGLMRRVTDRMSRVGLATFGQYQDYLIAHGEEPLLLRNAVVNNDTRFSETRGTGAT